MATKTLFCQHTASATVYASVWNAAGQVLDFNDNTFKTLGSATTPGLALTERSDAGGTGKSLYTGALDLADVNALQDVLSVAISFYVQAGGSPAPSTDATIGDPELLDVRFGDVAGDVTVEFEINVKSTAGLAAQISAWLVHRGAKVALEDVDATPTISVVVREHASGVALFTATGDVDDVYDDRFEIEQATPGFTDDRQYAAEPSIDLNGTVFTGYHSFSVQGA